MKSLIFSLFLMTSIQTLSAETARDGFLIGFDIGAADFEDKGFMGDNDRYIGLKIDFYLGGSLSPQWALMALIHGSAGRVDVEGFDVTVSNGFFGIAGQFSHPSGFVVRGGPGFVKTRGEVEILGTVFSGERSGFGVYLSPAYEVYSSDNFAIEVNANFLPQWYSSDEGGFAYALGGGIGFTWY